MKDPKDCLDLDPRQLSTLCAVMAALRSEGGCPWDKKQTHESLKRYLLEETYEVIEAIDQEDTENLVEELGDLLFQIVFHAQIGEEDSAFSMGDVIQGINEKMIYRHPHVFGDLTPDEVDWDKLKAAEKHSASLTDELHRIPKDFPALMASEKIQKKLAKSGRRKTDEAFDLEQVRGAADALEGADEPEQKAEALQKMLAAAADLARLNHLQPELLLKEYNDRMIDEQELDANH
ncbi:MAG: MazG family protein [Eubacteriaceae bacterium]|uniref:MazG family protein n=1 Tax=Candidatus Pseudoramibacter fermentans TaxID=2594427 RepID=A0A6L5GR01_9FIRM|nr:MazG family protein [Candidatus Pseudoramibacter fermentans]RRF92907.1 MAG: MazG family protein [Eubacteriaceae bacterium]